MVDKAPPLEGKYDAVVYGAGQMAVNVCDNMARNGGPNNEGLRVILINRTMSKAHAMWPTIVDRALTEKIGIGNTLVDACQHLKSPGGIIFPMIQAHDPRLQAEGGIDNLFFNGSEARWDRDSSAENIDPAYKMAPKGTIFVDLANSHPESTYNRMVRFEELGFGKQFLGTGVSGGSKGALEGPAIMPGGSREAYAIVGPILERISAHVGDDPCCAYMGDNEAGHFVKNVHNGVEYNIMAALAEAYRSLIELTGTSPKKLQEVFAGWKKQGLGGYLLDITCDILGMTDPDTGKTILDVILDEAGQKGTGKWTSQIAYDLGVPVEGITAALNERIHSGSKKSRIAASEILHAPNVKRYGGASRTKLEKAARDAVYGSMIIAYAQGFAMFTQINQMENKERRKYSGRYNFTLDLPRIAKVWRSGCIVRAALLPTITQAYTAEPELSNLMLAPNITEILNRPELQKNWRYFVSVLTQNGLPRDALSASLSYLDNARTKTSVAAMLQGQRDMFGEHGFGRLDKPEGGRDFHLPVERAYAVKHVVR